MTMKTIASRTAIALAILFVGIQLIPYGRNHTNPPSKSEPQWNSPQTRDFAKRACYDCHSNETVWPWYSNVAPVSWLVQHDVDEGREHLNFTEWDRPQKDAPKAAEEVEESAMPPWFFLPLHADAKLSDGEKEQFIGGLKATFKE